MIKRYSQFVNENYWSNNSLTIEEIEDQFLRIKEVLDYKVEVIVYMRLPTSVIIRPHAHSWGSEWNPDCYTPEVYEELEKIKARMEYRYNVIVQIDKPDKDSFLSAEIINKTRPSFDFIIE